MKYLSSEWLKLRKLQLLLVGLILLSIGSFVGLGTYYANRQVFIHDTQSRVMWGQLTFYHSQVFYPALLAIFVGISLMPEFERMTFEMLKANNVSIGKLLMSKLLTLTFILVPFQFLLVVIWWVGLKLDNISVTSEIGVHVKWVLLSLIGSLSILSLQSFILVKTKSFAKSVGFSAMGVMVGFVLMLVFEPLSHIFPYSQPMIGLRARTLADMSFSEFVIFIVVNVFYTLLFYKLTQRTLEKKG
ncbi:ABC transporter permease [Streptococcus mutans]|uniref:ABC transporter permease n=1 Tax=Streptococcus mutans TaxID=1309 RepID=UPI0002B5D556|nr:ABC transporter permease [Streptococcus mutans]EMB63981.1 hypothetical protein SMU22_07208 [Streptococcus mutans 4SM1]EMC47538.1 hypothetical protein SMU103_08215 [Streptococcus mutans SA38]NLQ50431.1 ABC transporter permease [Streptococcus mutans]